VGTKITGIARRQFRPNLQRVHITDAKGSTRTIRVCAQCIRSGAITKKVHSAPFKLPPGEAASKAAVAASEAQGKSRKKKRKKA